MILATAAFASACEPSTTWLCLQKPGESEHPLYAKLDRLWQTPKIPVCWERSSIESTTAEDRALVEEAIDETWNAALDVPEVEASERVEFVGWKSCDDDQNARKDGVRIRVMDFQPLTRALGNHLAGMYSGMILDFTFHNWGKECSAESMRDTCIRNLAVHEFGHALGFAHEQNRPDTPDTCNEGQGSDGDVLMGEWDLHSVMNYCNPTWDNGGQLSETDASAARSLYYPEISRYYCTEKPSNR